MVFLYNYLTHCSYHTTAFTLPFEDSFGDRHSFRPSKMPKKSQLSQHSSGRPRHRRKPLMWTTEGFISSSHNMFMYSYMHSYVKKCIYIYIHTYSTILYVLFLWYIFWVWDLNFYVAFLSWQMANRTGTPRNRGAFHACATNEPLWSVESRSKMANCVKCVEHCDLSSLRKQFHVFCVV